MPRPVGGEYYQVDVEEQGGMKISAPVKPHSPQPAAAKPAAPPVAAKQETPAVTELTAISFQLIRALYQLSGAGLFC